MVPVNLPSESSLQEVAKGAGGTYKFTCKAG